MFMYRAVFLVPKWRPTRLPNKAGNLFAVISLAYFGSGRRFYRRYRRITRGRRQGFVRKEIRYGARWGKYAQRYRFIRWPFVVSAYEGERKFKDISPFRQRYPWRRLPSLFIHKVIFKYVDRPFKSLAVVANNRFFELYRKKVGICRRRFSFYKQVFLLRPTAVKYRRSTVRRRFRYRHRINRTPPFYTSELVFSKKVAGYTPVKPRYFHKNYMYFLRYIRDALSFSSKKHFYRLFRFAQRPGVARYSYADKVRSYFSSRLLHNVVFLGLLPSVRTAYELQAGGHLLLNGRSAPTIEYLVQTGDMLSLKISRSHRLQKTLGCKILDAVSPFRTRFDFVSNSVLLRDVRGPYSTLSRKLYSLLGKLFFSPRIAYFFRRESTSIPFLWYSRRRFLFGLHLINFFRYYRSLSKNNRKRAKSLLTGKLQRLLYSYLHNIIFVRYGTLMPQHKRCKSKEQDRYSAGERRSASVRFWPGSPRKVVSLVYNLLLGDKNKYILRKKARRRFRFRVIRIRRRVPRVFYPALQSLHFLDRVLVSFFSGQLAFKRYLFNKAFLTRKILNVCLSVWVAPMQRGSSSQKGVEKSSSVVAAVSFLPVCSSVVHSTSFGHRKIVNRVPRWSPRIPHYVNNLIIRNKSLFRFKREPKLLLFAKPILSAVRLRRLYFTRYVSHRHCRRLVTVPAKVAFNYWRSRFRWMRAVIFFLLADSQWSRQQVGLTLWGSRPSCIYYPEGYKLFRLAAETSIKLGALQVDELMRIHGLLSRNVLLRFFLHSEGKRKYYALHHLIMRRLIAYQGTGYFMYLFRLLKSNLLGFYDGVNMPNMRFFRTDKRTATIVFHRVRQTHLYTFFALLRREGMPLFKMAESPRRPVSLFFNKVYRDRVARGRHRFRTFPVVNFFAALASVVRVKS